MKNISISPYSIIGATVGVAVGHYVFRSTSLLPLMVLGVVGGIMANKIDKNIQNKIIKKANDLENKIEKDTKDFIDNSKTSFDGDYSEITGEKVAFDPRVGYLFPTGVIKDDNPKQYFDIDIN
jgi:uncharacterized protein YcfJ